MEQATSMCSLVNEKSRYREMTTQIHAKRAQSCIIRRTRHDEVTEEFGCVVASATPAVICYTWFPIILLEGLNLHKFICTELMSCVCSFLQIIYMYINLFGFAE